MLTAIAIYIEYNYYIQQCKNPIKLSSYVVSQMPSSDYNNNNHFNNLT